MSKRLAILNRPPKQRQSWPRPITSLLLAACMGSLSGCYSREALVQRFRNDAMKHRVEEIDLGRFSVTMPRDPTLAETVEIDMHIFGTLARYKRDETEDQLEQDQHLFRHRTLLALRESSSEEFTDPDLVKFREKILAAANSVLEEPTIQSIGFHEVRFMKN